MTAFYIAGKAGADELSVADCIASLEHLGMVCTFDWTSVQVLKPYGSEHSELAETMARAVLSADLFVLIWSAAPMGALIETGIAVGAGIPVVVCGDARPSIFWQLPEVAQFESFDAFYESLVENMKPALTLLTTPTE